MADEKQNSSLEPIGEVTDRDIDALVDEITGNINWDDSQWQNAALDWRDEDSLWEKAEAEEGAVGAEPESQEREPISDGQLPEQDTPALPKEIPEKKGRRAKGRSLPDNIAEGIIYVGGILLISFILATIAWRWANDVLALNKPPITASVTVTDGETLEEVTEDLKEKGLIQYGYLFKLFASLTNKAEKITSGSYELSTIMDYSALLNNISSTSACRETVTVTIPEGYTVEEIFQLMENKGVCSYRDLMKSAKEDTFDYDFLKDVKAADEKRLEGYLFPDTYEFYKGAEAKTVISTMLYNFSNRFDDKMEAEMQLLGYSKNDIIIIASIIEKETDGSDQKNIASVIDNRLRNTWATPKGYLQVDSSIQYLLDERKETLTDQDLEIDSPYNTYKNAGLPIGAICNPGLTSIQAALEPNKSNYYYFMLGNDGHTHFFETESAFLSFKAEQQRGGNG